MSSLALSKLQKKLGYRFKNDALLLQALTHRSMGGNNNERLEFLGDGLLNGIMAMTLYQRFVEASEGELTRMRATLVCGETLAELATRFELGEHLILGLGELKSGGVYRKSILADSLEAILGAIYQDSDFDTLKSCVLSWYQEKLVSPELITLSKDPKTQLQEYLQAAHLNLPVYTVESVEGPQHSQLFTVNCVIETLSITTQGRGKSRRFAEQHAAYLAVQKIKAQESSK
jgi:ribonuclease-3